MHKPQYNTFLKGRTFSPPNRLFEYADLFSYKTKPVCSSAITTLCAMGMMASDTRISTAALKEMPKLTDPNYTMNIHLLTCLSMLLTVCER